MSSAGAGPRSRPRHISLDGSLVEYEGAQVHVLSTAFKYGITVYEGLRGYWNEDASDMYLFRLADHLRRLEHSAKIARIDLPVTSEQVQDELIRLIVANGLRQDVHVRILCFIAADDGFPSALGPVSWAVAAMPMERYPDDDPTRDGVHVGISHWTRLSDASSPPRMKAAANYMNSRLALLQARVDGYDDAVMVDGAGKVAEGPGYNLFIVRGGKLVTPPVTSGILEGITRDSIIKLAQSQMELETAERVVDKTELYIADEAFFCGSAKEITSILSVDRHPVGLGQIGPLTHRLRALLFETARGGSSLWPEWRTAVYAGSESTSSLDEATRGSAR